MKEDDLQVAVMAFLRAALTPATVVFHVPNGLKASSKRQAVRFKAMGMRAGVSDLILCDRGRHLEIELKLPGQNLRATQKEWAREMTLAGGFHGVCRSVEEVEAQLRAWGVDLRATTGRLANG